ncbi:hypothetical protein WG909_13170 [Peptostreptococcaceae bacterium AGR-M142]
MSQTYKIRPSEILDINDSYVAFCFDEACMYIVDQLKEGEKPRFLDDGQSYNKPSNNSELVDFMNKH